MAATWFFLIGVVFLASGVAILVLNGRAERRRAADRAANELLGPPLPPGQRIGSLPRGYRWIGGTENTISTRDPEVIFGATPKK